MTAPARADLARPGAAPWRTPTGLLIISVIPLVAGALRLAEVAGGPQLMPVNPRIDAQPGPVVVHIVAATAYAIFGAFQFPARLRRRHRAWHRAAGRVLVAAGLLVALSGLWMTVFYRNAPGGVVLWTVRLTVGSAMATALVLGFAAIRRRDLPAHRAWMIRAYALGLGAGTQTVTQGVGEAAFGAGDLSTALSMTAAWVINAAVAEWVIARGKRPGRPAMAR
ncbi:DUF2306 domain-containing protein [Paractinoplanes rhizophilus]|jgi:uncharacterized membrane protein|uniref:DUF2306 domain-containing protein n=1 Tax=Paractinoplanes rhizophilus TaxID=1416877 RepID=A0ABW2I2A1_9ACTN|nr:DUF2306 domain-containing protein [Actinoplanes sp.]